MVITIRYDNGIVLIPKEILAPENATIMHSTIEKNPSNYQWVPQVEIIHWAWFRTIQVMNITEIYNMQSV